MITLTKNLQYYKFCMYGFLKNFRFFDAFLILFLIEKGQSYTQIGILYAIREITINVFEVPSGFIADTFGRKSSLIGAFMIYIVSFAVYYFSSGFGLFVLAFILYGIADAFRSGTHKGMIMDYLKLNGWENQKINYYGHTRSWSQKGSAISSLFAGLIVFYGGKYENIFLYSIIPYLLNLMLIWSYPKEINHSIKKKKVKTFSEMWRIIKSFFSVIKKANVLKIINTSAVHSAYMKAVKDYIQPLMVNVALLLPIMVTYDAEKKNGVVIGIIYFFIYLLTSFASKNSAKIENKTKHDIPFITLILGFSAGIIAGFFYVQEFWLISIIAFVLIYIVENVRKPILTGYISDNVPNEILTSVISAQELLSTIMTALIAFLFGLFADLWGIGISFIVVSSSLIIFSLVISSFSKTKSKN